MRPGCAGLGALHVELRSESSCCSEETERTLCQETPTARESKDGPERNSGVFPQETEPETGRGGAGEPEHLKT